MARPRLSDADRAAIHALAKRWGKIVARQAFGPDGLGLDGDLTAMEDGACAAASSAFQASCACCKRWATSGRCWIRFRLSAVSA